MTLHKLSAGDGYTYLIRQVARHDAQGVRGGELAAYYAEKGEAPGRWVGAGVAALGAGLTVGSEVTEAHMAALFGEGRHPEADQLSAQARERLLREQVVALAAGVPVKSDTTVGRLATAAGNLGAPFKTYAAETAFLRRCAEAYVAEQAEHGYGKGNPMPEAVRSGIRTRIATAMFTETYRRAPYDARELSGFITRASRAKAAVAGYDLTFTPVKSVSTLWAIAPIEIARVIERAHDAAVAESLAWLEAEALYTRMGRDGIRQVKATGMIAAAFTHRDSRAGDPDLHTHVAVANKVQGPDGTWRAIDGRVLYKAAVAASERYNTAIEAHLRARLGVAFAERDDTRPGKRPVREIVGVSTDLMSTWQARRDQITATQAALEADFRAVHGRPPTPRESIRLAQQANLATREAKHEPRSYAQQRTAWHDHAVAVMGENGIATMVAAALRPREARRTKPARVNARWVEVAAAGVIETISATRATWQQWHVMAEARRVVRAANLDPEAAEDAYQQVVAAALSPQCSVPLIAPDPRAHTPAVARRADGSSMYSLAGMDLYTSPAVLAAEARLRALATAGGGRAIPELYVDLALLESAANGRDLNPSQAALVRAMATSGRRLRLAIAPAGSGKTTAMAVLARAWHDAGGTVLGLSPTAAAAAGLGEQIGTRAETLAKLVWHLRHPHDAPTPDWMRTVGADTLVILDEAGMAATIDLDAATGWLAARGATIRLIGDDQQLASIASGGVLRDIAHDSGALTLTELIRFADPSEGAATLALRAGDVTAVGFYLDRHRVDVGTEHDMAQATFQAWQADLAEGADAIMLAPRTDLVAALNQRARQARLAQTAPEPAPEAAAKAEEGPTRLDVRLADGNLASVGDLIITRHNDRRLRLSRSDYVRNGYRWRITAIDPDGAVRLTALRGGAGVRLDAAYVAAWTALGYATTIHAAQGLTCDRARVLADDSLDRQMLYVALTRGRHLNALSLITVGDGDEHTATTPAATYPNTPAEILGRIIARDGAGVSAATAQRRATTPEHTLAHEVTVYTDALALAAETLAGPQVMAAITDAVGTDYPDLLDDPAWPVLRGHLALLHLEGKDPMAELVAAIKARELDTARSPAAVLDWRLGARGGGPLPWLRPLPHQLATDPQFGAFLTAQAATITAQAGQIRDHARGYTPAAAPPWVEALGLDCTAPVIGPLAVWRAAMGVPEDEVTPTGPRRFAVLEAAYQQRLNDAALATTGALEAELDPIRDALTRLAPRLLEDPTWPAIHARLRGLQRAGIDVVTVLTNALQPPVPDIRAPEPDASVGALGLPDDLPAAALWWRLTAAIGPATLAATGPLHRPAWTATLTSELGADIAETAMTSAAFPALIAAVNAARHADLDPENTLAVAIAMTPLAQGVGDDGVPLPDLARALALRVVALTRHDTTTVFTPPTSGDEAPYPDPADTDAGAGEAAPEEDRGPAVDDQAWYAATTYPTDPTSRDTPPDNHDHERDDHEKHGDREYEQWRMPSLADLHRDLDQLATARVITDALRAQGRRADTAPLDTPAAASPARARLAALNHAAHDFYRDQFDPTAPGTGASGWARPYLTGRLHRRHPDAGYAPAGWTALIDYLRSRYSATDAELLATGLARTSRRGTLIDAFRDRLTFPLRAGDGTILGFTARRNPAHDHDEPGATTRAITGAAGAAAGPKYLNTTATELYRKSAHLYGLHHAPTHPRAHLVLVEGPLDADAITLASGGRYLGLAPLGTALTAEHAAVIADLASQGRTVIVATDDDAAGRKAATNAYWSLTEAGISPHVISWTPPDHGPGDPQRPASGGDPAQILTDHGPRALTDLLDRHRDHAGALLDAIRLIDDGPDSRVWALRQATPIIAAQHPDRWPDLIAATVQLTHIDEDLVCLELCAAARRYADQHPPPHPDPSSPRRAHAGPSSSTSTHPKTATPTGPEGSGPGGSEPAGTLGPRRDLQTRPTDLPTPPPTDPNRTWAATAEAIDPTLTSGRDWHRLARTLQRLHAAGIDVTTALHHAHHDGGPLPDELPGLDMHARLTAAHPDLLTTQPQHTLAPTLGNPLPHAPVGPAAAPTSMPGPAPGR